MNFSICDIDSKLGDRNADSFNIDLYRDLKADFIIANPLLRMCDWGGERLKEDVRWKYGTPHVKNATYAWIWHFIHHLSPRGTAGVCHDQRVHVHGNFGRGRYSEDDYRGKSRKLYGRGAGSVFLYDADTGLSLAFGVEKGEREVSCPEGIDVVCRCVENGGVDRPDTPGVVRG